MAEPTPEPAPQASAPKAAGPPRRPVRFRVTRPNGDLVGTFAAADEAEARANAAAESGRAGVPADPAALGLECLDERPV
jgi:hypothetical protein